MKKVFLLLLMASFISTKAMAGMAVFPQAVDFLQDSKKRSQTLNVVNQSKSPQTYRVSIVEYTQDESGRYHKAETVANSAQKYLLYSPKQFTLMPGKVQAIRVARKGLGDIKDGEYVSHLLVSEVAMPHHKASKNKKLSNTNKEVVENEENTEEDKEISVSIHPLLATSVPVTLYKGDHLGQATDVLSHSVSGDNLNLVLQRKGNISSRLILKVYDAKGEEIGRAGPVRIYTPNGKRNLSIKLKSGTKPTKIELNDALTNKKLSEKAL
ncbi:MAG: hypothetical protein VZR95_04255 [Alphaproteobacteria bacterium]